jgi:hypothetical protein
MMLFYIWTFPQSLHAQFTNIDNLAVLFGGFRLVIPLQVLLKSNTANAGQSAITTNNVVLRVRMRYAFR